jgi:glycosyltransferase involved in cell wall biosynthesis
MNSATTTVCMLTSAHAARDVRIYEKEANSLARAGYAVTIVVPNDRDEDLGGVQVCAVPRPQNRRQRMTTTLWQLYRKAAAVDAHIYHFHDPDLIPVGLLLKFSGKRVIYDVHEDVPRDILVKNWIALPLRKSVSAGAECAQVISALAFDGIVAATSTIASRFYRGRAVTVRNFPHTTGNGTSYSIPYASRANKAAYVGLINDLRGVHEMLASISTLPAGLRAQLILAGRCEPPELAKKLQSGSACERVDYQGWVPYEGIQPLLRESRLGLVVLHPSQAFLECQPLKLFEYMAAALPVVASDFPGWRDIVRETNCGLLVNPLDPQAIADAMMWIFAHPKEAQEMGQRGLAAVESTYNWKNQERILLDFYASLTNGSNPKRG